MPKAQPMPEGDTLALFQRGIDLFNAEEFFECHEFLEEVWTLSQQPDRWFLQALIHFAVGFYHHGRGNRNGATRQLRKGLSKDIAEVVAELTFSLRVVIALAAR